jgi:hypothetical protein
MVYLQMISSSPSNCYTQRKQPSNCYTQRKRQPAHKAHAPASLAHHDVIECPMEVAIYRCLHLHLQLN